MKVMISQPMARKHDDDIKNERNKIISKFRDMHIDVVDTFFNDDTTGIDKPDVYLLSKSIQAMVEVDAVYFVDGWRDARGCRIEHQICKEYGIKCLYSDFFEIDTLRECSVAPSSNVTINRTGGIIQSNDYPKITY